MAPNGLMNIRWLSYQSLVASKPYPTITVSTGNWPRIYPTIRTYTDCLVWATGGDRYAQAACTGNQEIYQGADLSRSFSTSPISLTLSLYTECNMHSFVICEGVGSKQHMPLTWPFHENNVRTNECVWHGWNEAGLEWDGTSGGQSRDWEWNQWNPGSRI